MAVSATDGPRLLSSNRRCQRNQEGDDERGGDRRKEGESSAGHGQTFYRLLNHATISLSPVWGVTLWPPFTTI